MPVALIVLIVILVASVAAGVYALVGNQERRAVLERAAGTDLFIVKPIQQVSARSRFGAWLASWVPASWTSKEEVASLLLQAGFEGTGASAMYAVVRIASAVLLPLLAVLLAPRGSLLMFVATVLLSIAVGFMAPPAILSNLARSRQERLRRALPDAMDLLVVCVEAGISLDAAILRVARELGRMHPDLAHEFLLLNRRVNAGVPREQALHGLYARTGLDDLRGLASNMIQSEKWGTSIATVLRVYAEGLRRKRKQAAEKRAATAPLRMMIPLALFIFPTMFIVLLGPAIIKISAMFKGLSS
ncbi:MAG TPA: type II secretion system F family protein [Gemmatimonadaceae bacterium]|nr:type II secretion system F family protein [Gemmatimonadaceae bacterium]